MINIKNRIKYENGEIEYEKTEIPFWPKKEEICHEEYLSVKKGCFMDIEDTNSNIINIDD